MSARSSEILGKGSSFIGVLKALDTLQGANAREQILEHLAEEFAAALRYGNLLVVGWYPVEWYAQLHVAIDASFHGGPMFARKLSHHATSNDIGGMYRQVISLLNIQTVFGQTPRIMNLYWKGGTIERLVVERGYARFRFSGWFGFNEYVWQDLMGGMDAVLEACGAKNGRCRAIGLSAGEAVDTLEIEARWT